VLQGAEIYRGKPILYSLGNLVSPKPGSTALFHLTYEGTRFVGLGLRPCRIAGGKVKQLPEKKRSAALKAWRGLCQAIAKSFPNKLSSLPEPPRTP
jgi:poly-gamma-glutamate capsule biosynthesis protein CapA/YwtB (metallophosphatase superfamily)